MESIDTSRHAQVQLKIQLQEGESTRLRGAQEQAHRLPETVSVFRAGKRDEPLA